MISVSARAANAAIALGVLQAEKARRAKLAAERNDLASRLDAIRRNCETLHGFMRESWHVLEPTATFRDNWHLEAICEHLTACTHGHITRLQINQPPGTMKSLTVSVLWNAWEWGPAKLPGLRYLTTSYREDWALRDSRKSRELIAGEWYKTLYPEVQLIKSGDGEFENTYRGVRKAVPYGSLTGGRGNRVVIDDPISVLDAESPVEREKCARLFKESVPSRVNDPLHDVIVLMMQRVHPDDLCGIIDQGLFPGGDFVKLILPMEYVRSLSVKTPYFEDKRAEGELLHEARFSREMAEAQKRDEYVWDTQYQQQPRGRDGFYFFSEKNILEERITNEGAKTYVPAADPLKCDRIIAIADTASKIGKKRDGTGIVYVAYTQYPMPKAVIVDWEVKQLEAATLEIDLPNWLRRCEELAREHRATHGAAGIFIEDKDSGTVLLQQAAKRGLATTPIPAELTALGKEGRAVSCSGHVYKGLMKVSQKAWDKTVVYKGRNKNHLVDQVTTFRKGHGTPLDEDELFDCFCYSVSLCFGDANGL